MSSKIRLSSANKKVVETVAETIIPSEGPDRPGAMDMDLVQKLMDGLGKFHGAHRILIIVCWFWEFSPFLSGKFSRLSRLTPNERDKVLGNWENSHFSLRRFALIGLKATFMAAFYNDPEVWKMIGYEQGCLGHHTDRQSGS